MHRSISYAALGALTAAVLTIAGCGGGASYVTTGSGPALSADARIDVNRVYGNNRRIDLAVNHLLPPERLGEEFSSYAVWIVPPGGNPVPAGKLDYDAGARRGRLTTVTPYEDFRVIITAEPGIPSAYPTGAVVVEQDVQS